MITELQFSQFRGDFIKPKTVKLGHIVHTVAFW